MNILNNISEKVKYFLFLSGAALAIGWFFHKKAKRKSCDDECKIETDDLMEKSNIEVFVLIPISFCLFNRSSIVLAKVNFITVRVLLLNHCCMVQFLLNS